MLPHLVFGSVPGEPGTLIYLPLSELSHTHFKGMTGVGKSTLLAYLIAQLIQAGVGVILIDPAGELARQVIALLVQTGYYERYPDALDRVVLLDLARAERDELAFPMNVLAGPYRPHATANVVLEAFKRVWPALQDGTSTNIETLISNGAYVLADRQLPLLPYMNHFYSNQHFHRALLSGVRDTHIREQFRVMQLEPRPGYIPQISETTIKRVNLLSFSPIIRYALAQHTNLIDFSTLIPSGRSVLINLRIADPNAKRLFGCLITEQLEAYAKARGPLSKEEEKQLSILVIDEMQNFIYQSGQGIENLFAEARKANVRVWIAHQYGAQFTDTLNAAISQAATKVVFHVDYEDALVSAKQLGFPIDLHRVKQALGNPFSPSGEHYQFYSEGEQWGMHAQDIATLPPREAYVQLPGRRPARFRTLTVEPFGIARQMEEIEDEYLRRYFRRQEDVQREIDDTMMPFFGIDPAVEQEAPKKRAPKPRSSDAQLLGELLAETPKANEEFVVHWDDKLELPEDDDE